MSRKTPVGWAHPLFDVPVTEGGQQPLTTAAITTSVLDAKMLTHDLDLLVSVGDRTRGFARKVEVTRR
jgi:hypothetical protein